MYRNDCPHSDHGFVNIDNGCCQNDFQPCAPQYGEFCRRRPARIRVMAARDP
jgi:hypothetical protein